MKKNQKKLFMVGAAVIALLYLQRNVSYTYNTPTGSTITHTGANLKGIGWY